MREDGKKSLIAYWKPTNKCRQNNGIKKNHHYSSNWFSQESSMDAKTSGWKFDKEQDIYIALKYSHIIYLLISKRKRVTS